jgi:hemoglobin/transferrin/lactoferrin receptor protein
MTPARSRISLLLLLLGAAPAKSQNFLDPLIVTASRTEQAASQVPYSATVLTAEFLREQSRRTLPDALQYSPGVLVQKTAHGHGSPFIRGFTGRQNLLLVDGVRLNNSTLRSGPVQYWNTVDPYSLDHIELIKNQGSVLYGSDAIGGTLQSFTKSSKFRSANPGQPYQHGSGTYEFRSNGQGSHVGRLEADTGIGGKFGVHLGITAKEFGDIEDSALGRMDGTGYPEEDFDGRLDWAIAADSTLTLAHNQVNQNGISRWHRTLKNPGWTHGTHVTSPGEFTANSYDQTRSLSLLRYAGENPRADAALTRWSATLSYQAVEDLEFQDRNPVKDELRFSRIDLQTLGLDLTLESPLGPAALIYGFDFYHDAVDSSGEKTNRARSFSSENLPLADDSNYELFGAFAQSIWKPTESWELTAGARYTLAHAKLGRFTDANGVARADESNDWDSVVGSIRSLYRIDPAWSIFGGISQAFRAPNLDDLTGNLTSKADSTALGSTQVSPENFITYELGARHSTETLTLQAAVFFSDGKDQISAVPRSGTDLSTVTTNATDSEIYGIECEAAWRFHPQWTLSGFAAWQEGEVEAPLFIGGPLERKSLPRPLPLTGSLALRWSATSGKFWLEGRLLGADDEGRITTGDQAADAQRIPTGGTPGYIVSSIHAGWRVNERFDLTCGVENLADQDYRNHGSGQNEPGFNAILGARVTW